MELRPAVLRLGLGGWEHEVFDRCLYPSAGLTSTQKLTYYAQFFQAVEVRATFWDDTLQAHDAREWLDAVKDSAGFHFTVKLHASFTHGKSIIPERTRAMRAILQELASEDKLGSLLVQFPYGFTNTSSHRYHLVKLAEIFSGFPVHVEFRHESWNTPGLIPFLQEYGLGVSAADIPRIRHYMPFITGTSGRDAYLRLHGRNEKGWLQNSYDGRYEYLYNKGETRELVKRIEALSARSGSVTVICNNTTEGKAVVTALQLLSALRDGKPVPVPAQAMRSFPILRSIANLDRNEALLLDGVYRRAI